MGYPTQWTPKELREAADQLAANEQVALARTGADAMRFAADLFEMARNDRVSVELIGIRVRNQLCHL